MGRLKCHTVTLLVFPQKIFISDQVLSKFDSNVQSNAEIYVADGILFIFKHSISLNVWKCSVLLLCHTVTNGCIFLKLFCFPLLRDCMMTMMMAMPLTMMNTLTMTMTMIWLPCDDNIRISTGLSSKPHIMISWHPISPKFTIQLMFYTPIMGDGNDFCTERKKLRLESIVKTNKYKILWRRSDK